MIMGCYLNNCLKKKKKVPGYSLDGNNNKAWDHCFVAKLNQS